MIFNEMREAVSDLMHAILHHPFNQALAAGTLPERLFAFYLEQDAMYLADYSRTLAIIAKRLSHPLHAESFMQFVADTLESEKCLHRDFLQEARKRYRKHTEKMPACFMYTHYLLSMASVASVEEAVASVLPCFWVYREVGTALLSRIASNNPYHAWITLYSCEAFDQSVQRAIDIVNALGEKAPHSVRKKMVDAFLKATALEWLFWQDAYEMRTWDRVFEKKTLSSISV